MTGVLVAAVSTRRIAAVTMMLVCPVRYGRLCVWLTAIHTARMRRIMCDWRGG